MSGILAAGALSSSAAASFVPVTRTYQTGGAGVETIPVGATLLVIEVWGGSGGGGMGASNPCVGLDGSGGGSGGYSRSSMTVTGFGGRTINYVSGARGVNAGTTFGADGTAGTQSSVGSGTFSMPGMTAGGGGGGNGAGGAAGVGGNAGTGGNVANSAGHAGIVSGAGGAGVVGVNGTGPDGGNGKNAGILNPSNGGYGLILFKYT